MIIKVSVVITDGVLWEQYIEVLSWLDENVLLLFPLGIRFCGRQ